MTVQRQRGAISKLKQIYSLLSRSEKSRLLFLFCLMLRFDAPAQELLMQIVAVETSLDYIDISYLQCPHKKTCRGG